MKKSSPRRRSVTITVLLAAAIGGLVVVSVGLVLIITGAANYRNTWELLQRTSVLVVDTVEKNLREHLNPARQLVVNIAANVAQGTLDLTDQPAMTHALRGAMAAVPQISGGAFWDISLRELRLFRRSDGRIQQITRDRARDLELRDNLAKIRKLERFNWGPPVHQSGMTLVVVAAPLFRNGKYLGAIATGVSVSELSAYLRVLSDRIGMTAFILYGGERILAHPSFADTKGAAAPAKSRVLGEFPDMILRQFPTMRKAHTADKLNIEIREPVVDGNRYVILSRPISGFGKVPWHVGVYAPFEDVDDQIRRLYGSIFVAFIVFLLSVLAAWILARRIARPIRAAAKAATDVGHLELDQIAPLPPSRITELNDQSHAFNTMLEGLRWFQTYVPRSLVQRLINNRGDMPVQSTETVLTVMFVDIIGFTHMSESLPPSEVGEMLNAHFEIVNAAIEAEGGTLDKYIGDAVMAFWGAPEKQDDHADRACRAALAIASRLSETDHKTTRWPDIRVKIALHTGPLIVGNIGAEARMNYTVIGDTVNTGSRIESLCSKFDDGGPAIILLSQETADQIEDRFTIEPAGKFEVKGREKPVAVFKLLGEPGSSREQ